MRLAFLLQLGATLALVAVGFVLAGLHRSIVALMQATPAWIWAIWAGYAFTLFVFAYATWERRA